MNSSKTDYKRKNPSKIPDILFLHQKTCLKNLMNNFFSRDISLKNQKKFENKIKKTKKIGKILKILNLFRKFFLLWKIFLPNFFKRPKNGWSTKKFNALPHFTQKRQKKQHKNKLKKTKKFKKNFGWKKAKNSRNFKLFFLT